MGFLKKAEKILHISELSFALSALILNSVSLLQPRDVAQNVTPEPTPFVVKGSRFISFCFSQQVAYDFTLFLLSIFML